MTLLDRYADYEARRAVQSGLEELGEADADDWYALDDEGVELAGEFAAAYEGAVRAASTVVNAWESGDLAGAVNGLQQVLMIDTMSSASCQHYIDTGRYLQEGETA